MVIKNVNERLFTLGKKKEKKRKELKMSATVIKKCICATRSSD